MKSQGEIEAAVCEGITRFEQDYKGVLTAAEQQLVKALAAEKGRDLLKQVRTHLVETARPVMEAMIEKATGVKVVSMHHDISTTTGEEVVIFTLAASPCFRETKKQADF